MNIFYYERGSYKELHQYTPQEDGQYQFKRIRDSRDDIDIEAQKKTRGYGLKQLREELNLVLPWLVDGQMKHIPCLKVDKEKHTITLNLITQGENEIKKLVEIKIVPVLYMGQLNFDQLVNKDWPKFNKIHIC